MARYSVATTKDNLSKLIDKALAGEEVVITRHGKPAVELRIVEADAKPQKRGWAYYQAELDGLEKIPVNNGKPIMQQLKDEYESKF
jgi:prevent-host-death family protein